MLFNHIKKHAHTHTIIVTMTELNEMSIIKDLTEINTFEKCKQAIYARLDKRKYYTLYYRNKNDPCNNYSYLNQIQNTFNDKVIVPIEKEYTGDYDKASGFKAVLGYVIYTPGENGPF